MTIPDDETSKMMFLRAKYAVGFLIPSCSESCSRVRTKKGEKSGRRVPIWGWVGSMGVCSELVSIGGKLGVIFVFLAINQISEG
jgi:hypothetical protein